MAMVRYFCGELGATNTSRTSDVLKFEPPREPLPFRIHYLTEPEFNSTPSAQAVKQVLLAANKAVAHANINFIDQIPEDAILVQAINQTEQWIRERIYKVNDFPFEEIMARERKSMGREKPVLAGRDS